MTSTDPQERGGGGVDVEAIKSAWCLETLSGDDFGPEERDVAALIAEVASLRERLAVSERERDEALTKYVNRLASESRIAFERDHLRSQLTAAEAVTKPAKDALVVLAGLRSAVTWELAPAIKDEIAKVSDDLFAALDVQQQQARRGEGVKEG